MHREHEAIPNLLKLQSQSPRARRREIGLQLNGRRTGQRTTPHDPTKFILPIVC